jgi:hypothetical protein
MAVLRFGRYDDDDGVYLLLLAMTRVLFFYTHRENGYDMVLLQPAFHSILLPFGSQHTLYEAYGVCCYNQDVGHYNTFINNRTPNFMFANLSCTVLHY